ncbi:MAG: hypothetical protein RBS72_09305 [Sedimentisphaerales bacterium]|jgi:Leucine-rich repeat (LRR) protein|nr:hypothetical protein [Sedimentisphaerales bacterium]HNY80716.1 hypothetical protein [Sedimentisphaerales bacterium]HOC65616.1 hypothetical protein [Sedimentisphaerales bacterium]HOH66520.1 hypothetical protein [Sedimentisphaerales bacterium]HPY51010.1 hypothetical protein [Sedimentisphaerales bacterium]
MDIARQIRVVWILTVLCGAGLKGATGMEARTLHFPTDRSLGKVLVCEPGPDRPLEGFFHWIRGEDWKYLADARGNVAVPPGKWISLNVERKEAWSDLSPLRNLQPDDLCQLGIHGSYSGGAKPGDACMQHVAHLTGLRVLDLSQTNITGAGMKWVAGLQNLRRLTAPDRMDDAGLAHVARLPALTGLYLRESRVTNAGLRHLAGLQGLEELALGAGRITDAGLVHLGKLPRLRYLLLQGDGFSDAGFVHLKNVPSLRILHFGHLPQTTDAGLAHLSALTQVQDMSFHWSENITDEGVRHLAALPHLRSLDVARSRVTDAGLAHLRDVKTLESLWLPSEGISDTGLEYLSQLPRLRSLSVSRAYRGDSSGEQGYYTDKGIRMLAHCRDLEELSVGSIAMTDASMEAIATLGNLRNLALFGCTAVTDEGLKELASLKDLEVLNVHDANATISGLSCLNGLSNLRRLDIDGVKQDYSGLDLSGLKKLEQLTIGTRRDGGVISDADVACLAGLTQLTWLQIGNPAIRPPSLTDQGLASLAGLTQMDRLTIGGPELTDNGLGHLRGMKKLDMLNIYGGRFTGEGLEHLEDLDALAYLTLIGEHSFSQDDIRHLFEALPHLYTAQIGSKPPGQTYLRDKVPAGARRGPRQDG